MCGRITARVNSREQTAYVKHDMWLHEKIVLLIGGCCEMGLCGLIFKWFVSPREEVEG